MPGLFPSVLTVSALTRQIRSTLEQNFPPLWVEGEISNLACPSSGHWYFSLKDEAAQIRCAMFRNRNRLLRFRPEDGQQLLVRARVSLYEPRGDYQLIAEHMEEAGDGALRRAFEQLKVKLASEGLFDESHKKSLPDFPKQIGVITSPTGAAIRDILTILKRRFPSLPVLVYPVPVQGKTAAPSILRMLQVATKRNECDVLILSRGGGSLEDLWSFNDEEVARAIYESDIPIVTGIGHEVDFTIADFVADLRAPTPSGAAELVSPNADEWLLSLQKYFDRMQQLLQRQFLDHQQQLQWLIKRLQQLHPGQMIIKQAQRLDELEQRMINSMQILLRHQRTVLAERYSRLMPFNPQQTITRYVDQTRHLRQRLDSMMQQLLERKQQQLTALGRTLNTVSPLATLGRGYGIVRALPDYQVVRNAREVKTGDTIEAMLAKGRLICDVVETKTK